MSIDAKFTADFSQFTTEVDRAAKELEALEQWAGVAAGSLSDIGKTGGTGLKEITEDTKKLNKEQDSLSGILKSVRGELLAFVSVRAITGFIGDTIEAAGALKVLSQQTQINVTDLQNMAGAMSESGVSTQQLGNGLLQLSKRIAGGDDSVSTALATMGLSLQDVAGLQGQELFLKVERGLATLKGSLRDTTAAALFGDKLGAAMAGASEGIDAAMEKQRRLNTTMSKEAVDALDAYSASITRAETNIRNMLANALGPLAEGFNTIIDTSNKGASKWAIAWAIMQDAMTPVGTGTEHLAGLIDQLNQKNDAAAASTRAHAGATQATTAALTDEARAAQTLALLEQNANVELTAAQIANLERLKAIGLLDAKHAEALGININQFHKYTAEVEAAKKAAADLATAQREADALVLTSYKAQIENLKSIEQQRSKSYGTVAQIESLHQLDAAEEALTRTVYAQLTSEKDRMVLVEQNGKRRLDIIDQIMAKEAILTQRIAEQLLAEAQAHKDRNAALGLDARGYAIVTDKAEILRIKIDELRAQAAAGVPTAEREARLVDEYAQAAADAARESENWWRSKKEVNAEAEKTPGALAPARGAIDAIGHSARQAGKGFDEMSAHFVATFATMAEAAKAANQMLEDAYKKAGFIMHPIISGGAGYNPTSYGQTGNNFYITQPLGSPDQIARAVGDALTATYRSSGQRLPA